MQGHIGKSSSSEGVCVEVSHESLFDALLVSGDVGLGSSKDLVYVEFVQRACVCGGVLWR